MIAQNVPKINLEVVRCHDCGYSPHILLVNGEEETLYCKQCAKQVFGDMVLSNDGINFRQERRSDGLIVVTLV